MWLTTSAKSTITTFKGLLTRGWPLTLFGPLLWGFFQGSDQMAKLSKAFFMREICRQEWSSIFLSLCSAAYVVAHWKFLPKLEQWLNICAIYYLVKPLYTLFRKRSIDYKKRNIYDMWYIRLIKVICSWYIKNILFYIL